MEQQTISAWLTAWQATDRTDLAPTTRYRYDGVLAQFLAWFAATEQRPMTGADVNPITLVGYRSALQATRATNTVNTHLSALRVWCRWLNAQGYLAHNPALRLKLVRTTTTVSPTALTAAQVNALLRQAQQTRYPVRNTALVQLLIQTGLRIGEGAALLRQDVALGARSGSVRVRAGKGNVARSVPLNDSARAALASYLAPTLGVEPTLKAVAAIWTSAADNQPLWVSERKQRLSVREMSRMIQHLIAVCAMRGLVPVDATPHSLRHTFATHYLARHPYDLVGLARLLGHRSVQTTQIYVQPTDAAMALRVSQIDLNAYAE
jgi:site-specific recombinase XerD